MLDYQSTFENEATAGVEVVSFEHVDDEHGLPPCFRLKPDLTWLQLHAFLHLHPEIPRRVPHEH